MPGGGALEETGPCLAEKEEHTIQLVSKMCLASNIDVVALEEESDDDDKAAATVKPSCEAGSNKVGKETSSNCMRRSPRS